MWKQLSLRSRLFLPLGVMFVAALVLGASALEVFSPGQLKYENEPEARAAQAVARALNAALASSSNPQQTLEGFVASLGSRDTIQFRPADAPQDEPLVRISSRNVPQWFIDRLVIPDIGAAYPIAIEGKRAGDIIFSPDISADIFEKWVGFVAITISGAGLMLLTSIIAFFTAGALLRPLRELGEGLTRIGRGYYDTMIPVAGPPEIQKSCEEANELARTLSRLSHDNRELLRQLVSLQDDERRMLARELHDELGPLLFAIRANTTALLEIVQENRDLVPPAQEILQSVEALQTANRRILQGLHPLYIVELGLEGSIRSLIKNARARSPELKIAADLDPNLSGIDRVSSETIYRVIQEAVTNVLKHARATAMKIEARIDGSQILIEIADNGSGLSPGTTFGRGLNGMNERARALSGTFELLREDRTTLIRCRLPFDRDPQQEQDD
jgi:two-component system, NarL family, sensor histidine kinase UhpB